MRNKKFSLGPVAVVAALAMATLMTATRAEAQTVKVIHSFRNAGLTPGGYTPSGGLIFDSAGNLYGTDQNAGKYSGGTVYELTPNGSGGWTQKVLYNFDVNTKDGYSPYSNVVFDGAGNLYGTTYTGGAYNLGTVYKLTPGSGGIWTEQVLHSFGGGTDGTYPWAGLVVDTAGNLYGTASQGGTNSGGIAFELKHASNGSYVERVMHNFGSGTDGLYPIGGLLMDASGNLYGTTQDGGVYFGGRGTVYELKPQGGGNWAEMVLHSFGNGQDGEYPQTALIFDAAGNLYGTTQQGGTRLNGTVFQMTPTGGGSWAETVVYNFDDPNLSEGILPSSGVIMDSAGNLYGETAQGTGNTFYGSVFKLTPGTAGTWAETQMVKFAHQNFGSQPEGGLILDSLGHLYGTTESGGLGGGGIVFEVTP
jgi:uncharacterized repeat protein (TIGR03803 family)